MADIIIREALESAPMTKAERSIVVASADKRIDAYGSADLAAELNNIVKWVALDVGVRLSEADITYTIVRMAEILNRHYGYLTLREVRYAFELMLTGDLDEFLPKRDGQPDRSAYGAFNMVYVCKVLNAYRSMRGAALKRYRANLPPKDNTPSAEDEERAEKEIRGRLNDCYKKHIRGEAFTISLIDERLFYDILADMGLAEKFDQPIARDITGAMSKHGKDAPYARERRAVIAQCFDRLNEQGVTEL